jgi:hypothetical protein
LKKEGILHQFTVPYTPQQNSVAERKNCSLIGMAKCMLLDTGLRNRLRGEVICITAYLQNRLLSRTITKTPYGHWYDSKPDISCIRIFGSKAYSLVPKQVRKKWGDKAMVGVPVSFDTAPKGYQNLDPETKKVWGRSVHIIENVKRSSTK